MPSALPAFICNRSASTTSPLGIPATPPSPSSGFNVSTQRPLRSGSRSHAPPKALQPPTASTAASSAAALVVVLGAKVGDELFAAQVAQRVLELHQLNEQVVLGIQPRRGHRALEEERQPL